MAELLIALTQLTAGSLGARPLAEEEHALAGEPLPPPIIPGNYDKKAASCVMSVSAELAPGQPPPPLPPQGRAGVLPASPHSSLTPSCPLPACRPSVAAARL